jgi:hypothetical protein
MYIAAKVEVDNNNTLMLMNESIVEIRIVVQKRLKARLPGIVNELKGCCG